MTLAAINPKGAYTYRNGKDVIFIAKTPHLIYDIASQDKSGGLHLHTFDGTAYAGEDFDFSSIDED